MEGAQALVERAVEMATLMIHGQIPERAHVRGGRKAHRLPMVSDAEGS